MQYTKAIQNYEHSNIRTSEHSNDECNNPYFVRISVVRISVVRLFCIIFRKPELFRYNQKSALRFTGERL